MAVSTRTIPDGAPQLLGRKSGNMAMAMKSSVISGTPRITSM